jgi:hypothetical protein
VRRPLHEAWLWRDPAEGKPDLIDEASAAHATDGTRPRPASPNVYSPWRCPPTPPTRQRRVAAVQSSKIC